MTPTQKAQTAIFVLLMAEFIGFSCGWLEVPIDTEDAKFFYMLFGVFNSILSVKAFDSKGEQP